MSSSPRVSVILPTYNRQDTVRRAADSVLAQTYDDLELIIVDDASDDATPEILSCYRHEPRVSVIRSERNRGGGAARNLGIENARGALIAFQDSDDFWLPEKLKRQVELLEQRQDCGLCYCRSIYAGQAESYYLPRFRFDRLEGDMSCEVLKSSPVSTQTLLLRSELLERSGAFDPAFKRLQDWDLVIRLAQETEFAFIPEPLAIVFETAGNISSVSVNDAIYRNRILEKYADLFQGDMRSRARHNYIAGRIWQTNGEYGRAAENFFRSYHARPGLKAAAFWLFTRMRATTRIRE